jgi:hypothetical protein
MTDPKWITTLRRREIREWAAALLDGQFANWQTEGREWVRVPTRDLIQLLCLVARRPLPPRQTAAAEEASNE